MDFVIYLSDEDSDTPEPKRRRYNEDESQPGKLLQSYPTSAQFNNGLSNQPDKQWCCGRFIIKTWFRLWKKKNVNSLKKKFTSRNKK
jgi:hypothetical protein